MAKWYLANAGGSPIGPVRTDALLRRIRGGTLAPETLVWAEGMDDWIPVERIPELSAEFMRDDSEDEEEEALRVHLSGLDSDQDATVARPIPQPPSTVPVIPSKVLDDIAPESARTVVAPQNRGLRVPSAIPNPDVTPPSSGRDSWRTVVVPQAQDPAYVPPPPSTGFPIDTSAFEAAQQIAPLPPVRGKADSVTHIRAEGQYIAPPPPRVVPSAYPSPREDADVSPKTVRLPGLPPARGHFPSESTVIAPLPDPAARRRPVSPPPAAPGGTLMLPQSPFAQRRPSAPPGYPPPQPAGPARAPQPMTPGGTAIFPRGFGIPPQQPPAPQAPQPSPQPSAYAPVVTQPVPETSAAAPQAPVPAPSPASKANRTRLTIAVVFVVGLVVGIFGARKVVGMHEESGGGGVATSATPSKGARLLVPCFSALLPELRVQKAGKDVPCGDLTLSLKNDPALLTLTLKGPPADGLAARTPELVARVLPNLPDPSISRALMLRQVLRLDLRGQPDTAHKTQAGIKAYHDAELLVEGYESMGGHRFARWLPKEGRIEAENTVTGDGRVVVIRFYPEQGAPSGLADADQGLDGPDATWKAGAWSVPVDEPYVIALRKKMMDQGWWFDDATAFLSAAVAAGLDKNGDTAEGLAVVAEWLRTSDQWDVRTRVTIWNVCLTRSISATRGFTRQRFDELAGVWKDANVFTDTPAFRTPDEESAMYARIFAASIGSPAHAYCASAVGQRLLEESDEGPENKVIRHAPDGPRGIAQRLLGSSKFVAAMRTEMAKARSQLLKPGPPDM